MNPVLQELLSQFQQRQISFEEFKLDLTGLCRMSPGIVPAARLLVESAVAKGLIPANSASQLINAISVELPPISKTMLRTGQPGAAVTPSDKTAVINPPVEATVAMEKTVAMNKPTTTATTDAIVLTSGPSGTQTSKPDATVLIDKPAVNKPVESTVAMTHAASARQDATRLMESGTAHRTQQQSASSTAEKTQRISPPSIVTPVSPEKTQRIDYSAGVEKTQRIEPGGTASRQISPAQNDGTLGTGLDFDLGASPDKTQRIPQEGAGTQSGTNQSGTKQNDSLMGTMERFLTDGPLPQGVDMGVIPVGPGTIIKERFLLKEQIGSGGMGVVYSAIDRRKTEARDPNPLVAIKILGSDFARHPKSLIALQREARKAQELAHPNVATVYDFDREGDAVFMTMELLNGRSLDGLTREIRGKGISREEAWPIIRGIAEGLAYAHRKGLVHSDLKPANVFLVEDNFPKLLDFGIARAVPSRLSKQAVKDIFDAGSLGAYTVPYATPEMVEGGEPHPADDIYALGLMAYELLGGVHPYKRQGAIEANKLGMKPAPIKGLPRREWKTIESAIYFNRADRPQDADAFLKALRGITKLQKSLIAATAVLATTAVYFAYSSYVESGPEIPFASLPVATQQQFSTYMEEGDKLWSFYVKDKNILALQEAVEQYASAYDLHPRNRDAVKALKKVADAALDATKNNPEQQREFAKSLAERSVFLSKDYPPMHRFAE